MSNVTPPENNSAKPGETTPGVRALRQLWNIPSKAPRPKPPEDVVSDIYRVPARKNGVPPRSHGKT
jgi:hypothetical protein